MTCPEKYASFVGAIFLWKVEEEEEEEECDHGNVCVCVCVVTVSNEMLLCTYVWR